MSQKLHIFWCTSIYSSNDGVYFSFFDPYISSNAQSYSVAVLAYDTGNEVVDIHTNLLYNAFWKKKRLLEGYVSKKPYGHWIFSLA